MIQRVGKKHIFWKEHFVMDLYNLYIDILNEKYKNNPACNRFPEEASCKGIK